MKQVATLLAVCVAILLALGLVMLYSASMTQKGEDLLIKQSRFAALGLAVCVAATALDYRRLRKLVWPSLVITVLLLGYTLTQREVNGAQRWIFIGGFNFQPSELAKLAVLLFLADYGARHPDRMRGFVRGLLVPGAIVSVVLVLILAGRDFGATMLLGLVAGLLLLVAGCRLRLLLPIGLAGFTAIGVLLMNNSVRSDRIDAWLHPERYADTIALQYLEGAKALGSGGLLGVGLGDGRQKQGYVPEHHTDFILTIIGEEFGLIATLGVLMGFATLLGCGFLIAWQARDPFGQLLATGITFLIGLQVFINIGVITGVLPNKGLPLPFISYGGSNLVMMLASVGILLSIARQAVARPAFVAAPAEENPFAVPST